MMSLLAVACLLQAPLDTPRTVRRFVERTEIRTLKSVDASRDGRQLPRERLPKLERTDTRSLELEAMDEWIQLDGAPICIRTFDAASGKRDMRAKNLRHPDSKPVEVAEEFDSVLVGEALHVTRAKERWTLGATDECSLSAETLGRLRADLSLNFLVRSGKEVASKPRVLGPEAVAILMDPSGPIPKDVEGQWADVSKCRGGQVAYAGSVTVTPKAETRYEGTLVQEFSILMKGQAAWSSQPRPELGIRGESDLTGKGRVLYNPEHDLVVLLELDVLAKTMQSENVVMELTDKTSTNLKTVEREERTVKVCVTATLE